MTGMTFSQNRTLIDSLKKELNASTPDKQFGLLNSIGWEYRFSNPDSTIYFSQKAYDFGQRSGVKNDLAKSLNFIGVAYNYKGDRLKSFEYYQKAITVAESQNDSVQMAYSNNNIGRLLFEQGVLPKSFNYYVKALKLFNATSDSSGIAYVKQSMANLYRLQQDFKKSEDAHLDALSIRIKLKNARDIMSAFTQLGILFQELNLTAKSNFYFLKADSIGRKTNDKINLAEIQVLLAENYLKDGKIYEAERVGSLGARIISENKNMRMLPQALLLMGKISLAKRNFLKARNEFTEALKVSRTTKSSAFQIESYFQLAQVAKLMGNEKEAIGNMNNYLVLKDSVQDLDLARQIERLQFELQIETKEKENEFLKLKQAQSEATVVRQKLMNILAFVVMSFFIVLAIVALYVNRKRDIINRKLEIQNQQIVDHQKEIDQQNETLQKRNQLLSELNNEKDTLMSIVAHDLKSPLNRITGLVSLIEMDGDLNNSQQDYVKLIKEVTKSGSDLITDLLDVHEIEQEKNVPLFTIFNLTELIRERVDYFKVIANSKKIKIDYVDPGKLEFTSDPTYLSRIMDNLLSNAIKFSTYGSSVKVGLSMMNSQAQISIKDTGPGFLESDKKLLFQKFKRLSARPTGGESSNGLGLAIVKTLVDRLAGTISLNSQPGMGSEFIMVIPSAKINNRSQSALNPLATEKLT